MNKHFFDGVPLQGYVASMLVLHFEPEIKKKKKKQCGYIQ